MLYDSHWSRDREKFIIGAETALAKYFIDNNISPVIDDTNFRNVWPGFVQDYHRTKDYDSITYEEIFVDCDLEEAIRRDATREKSVGRNVITKMALRNGLVKFPDLPLVLVDIDGTLAYSRGRERYLKQEKKDWKSYYALLGTDAPHTHIFKWVAELSKDHTIVIVSGRGAEYQKETMEWFEKVWTPNPLFPELDVPKFPVFLWLFRDAGDRREDSIVKTEFLDLLPKTPELILDDRPSVIRAWRSRGLKVIPVAGSCDEF
jgi:hypothetical protein